MWRAWAMAVLLVGCGDDESRCEMPGYTTYDCAPITSGTGCLGGPIYDDNTGRSDDKGKMFPDQCNAEIPVCSEIFHGERQQYICVGTSWVAKTG